MLYDNQFPSYCSTNNNCQDLCVTCLDGSRCIKCKSNAYLDDSGLCKIHCKPGYEFKLVSPYCTEICGDGKNMGSYECDDGNVIDGDGCDHNCKKESNVICTKDNLQDICSFPSYSISFVEGMYKLVVAFNYEVKDLNDYISQLKVKIKDSTGQDISIPIEGVNKINNSALMLSLYLDNISISASDKLYIEFPGIPTYVYGNESIGTKDIEKVAIPSSAPSKAVGAHVIMAISLFVWVFYIVVMILRKKSLSMGREMIEAYKLLVIMSVVNIHRLPDYMKAMYTYAEYFTLSFIPKALISLKYSDSYYSNEFIYDKAANLQLLPTTNFLINFSTYLILAMVMILLFIVLKYTTRCKPSKISTILAKMRNAFQYSAMFVVASIIEVPMLICIFAQFRNVQLGNSALVGIGMVFAIIALLAYAVWLIFIGIFVHKHHIYFNSTEYRQKYGQLYDRFSCSNKQSYTLILFTVRKLSTIIVLIPTQPYVQILILMVTTTLYLVWILIVKPYKTRIGFLSSIFTDISYLLSLIVIIFLNSPTVFIDYYSLTSYLGVTFLIGVVYSRTIPCLVLAIYAIREKRVIMPIKRLEDTVKSLKNEDSNEDSRNKEDTVDKTLIDTREFRVANQKYQNQGRTKL